MKKLRIAIIEDDPDVSSALKVNIEEENPNKTIVKCFEEVYDAKDWPADIVFMDVSAVSGNSMGSWGFNSRYKIIPYMDLYPSCKVFVTSCLSVSLFKHIKQEVLDLYPNADIECIHFDNIEKITKNLVEQAGL